MSGKDSTSPKRWRSAGTKETPAACSVARPRCVTSSPSSRMRRRSGLAQAGDGLHELVLAVAGHAGDAEDLAGADLEADAAHDLTAAVVA